MYLLVKHVAARLAILESESSEFLIPIAQDFQRVERAVEIELRELSGVDELNHAADGGFVLSEFFVVEEVGELVLLLGVLLGEIAAGEAFKVLGGAFGVVAARERVSEVGGTGAENGRMGVETLAGSFQAHIRGAADLMKLCEVVSE